MMLLHHGVFWDICLCDLILSVTVLALISPETATASVRHSVNKKIIIEDSKVQDICSFEAFAPQQVEADGGNMKTFSHFCLSKCLYIYIHTFFKQHLLSTSCMK